MSDKKHLRKLMYVDPKLQGSLIVRVVFYWVVCLIGISLMLLCWQIISGPPRPFSVHLGEMWSHYGAALVASLLLLPLVIVDILQFSNRFVGPLFRLRRSIRQLARGEKVEPIEFRDTDFWQDFANEFNTLARRVENQETDGEHHSHEPQEEDEPVAIG